MVMERRKTLRSRVIINVDVRVLAGATYYGCARDISYGGVCIDIYGDTPPSVGAKAELTFIIWTGTENIQREMKGVLVRASPASLALAFADDGEDATKLVDEVLDYQQFERRTQPRKRPSDRKNDG